MNAKSRLLLILASLLCASSAFAQDERKPAPPTPPAPPPIVKRTPPAVFPAMPVVGPPVRFLGVSTSQVPSALAAQLGLPESLGLVVDEVMPESPAGRAGVQKFDVLRLFNEQQLFGPNQLAALVRMQAWDAEVSLTLLRKGQEQKVSLRLNDPMRMPPPEPASEWKDQIERFKGGVGDKVRQLQEQTRDYERRVREYHELLKKWQAEAGAAMPKLPDFPPAAAIEPADILREVRPGGPAQVRFFQPNGTVTYNTAHAKLVMKDHDGEIEVTSNDGRRKLIAKNAKGEVVFDGPIDTPEQIKALPEDLRNKVTAIELRTKTEFNIPVPPPQPSAPGGR